MSFNTCYQRWARLLVLCGCLSVVHGSITPFLPQSFFFDWNGNEPVPIPTTEQCDTINITWGRSNAVGPNPVAPYYLQVYTSTEIVPFVIPAGYDLNFGWTVPFAPGTQYQICMFDTNGNTGGCQATYTVIPSSSGTPTCSNVTFPTLLDVDAIVDNGPMSQYGWIDQCTDLSVTPKNGTAPYILTIAPALHPPYNITASKMEAMNWTVSLSWASPFFIGLVDANGNMWSYGPLHSGGGGPTACLAGNATSSSSDSVKPYIAISSGVSGLAVGLLCGTLAAYLFMRRRYKNKLSQDRFVGTGPAGLDSPFNTTYDPLLTGASQYRPVPTMNRMGTASPPYQFEPLVMPDEQGRLTYEQRSPTSSHGPGHVGHTQSVDASPPGQQGQVYVLHHDSNIPPVTIFHETGTQIVELPPRYPRPTTSSSADGPSETRTGSDSRSDGSRTDRTDGPLLHPVRRPGAITKGPRQPR